jgi:hypothetical protein
VFVKLVVLAWEKERRAEHMQITLRIARQQLSLRALLLIAGAALMIIVGLLGMHTFSADVAGHDAHHSATASTAPEHSTPMAATSDISGAIACDDTCLMGTGQSHSDMVTACVLALLAALLLLVRPMLLEHLGPPLRALASSLRLRAVSILPRTPSLIFLSISRT